MEMCSGPHSQADLRLILPLRPMQAPGLGLQIYSPTQLSSGISSLMALQPLETNPRPSALFLMAPCSKLLIITRVLPITFSGCLLVQPGGSTERPRAPCQCLLQGREHLGCYSFLSAGMRAAHFRIKGSYPRCVSYVKWWYSG